MRRFLARLSSFFRRGRAEREMAREMAAHLGLLEEQYRRQGLAPEEAALAARRAFGGLEQAKELHRDERSLVWLEQAWQDIRHAVRNLGRSPAFAAVAVLSLALGIGMNTSIFTLVNGILLKRLAVPDADRIVQIQAQVRSFKSSGFSFPVFRGLRRQAAVFADLIGFTGRTAVLEREGEPQKVDLELVTGSFFSFFGARPTLGRLLDEEDDRVEGAHPVCVLSFEAWQSHFGGDPGVLDRTIRIDGVPLQVVGVAPPGFAGPELQRRFDLWAPTAVAADFTHNQRESTSFIWIHVLGRLQPGLSLAQARERLRATSRAIEDGLPAGRANADAVYGLLDGSKGYDNWRTRLHDPLVILMAAVGLVLLVACANLANLLLARSGERQREFVIKLSLGISRWRLLRQLLVETAVLTFAGGAAAVLVSLALTPLLLARFNAGNTYLKLRVAPDGSVLLFALGACVLTTLAAGFYPAWKASGADAAAGLKGASPSGARPGLLRRTLILIEVTLAVVLVFGASLFAHSLRKLKTIDLGYDIDRVLSVDINQRWKGKGVQAPTRPPALGEVLARVRQLPQAEAAAFSSPSVLSGAMMASSIKFQDVRLDDVYILFAGPGYFSTLRLPLLRGRDFSTADRFGSPPVVIVNQRLAAQAWPGQDPLGKHFDAWGMKNAEVIGVVGNSKYQNVREATRAIAYVNFDQAPGRGGSLAVRCRGTCAPLEKEVRNIVKSAAPDYQVSNISTMELLRDNLLALDRLLALLSTLFGVLGASLALLGIYGLISYTVTRRTREIGIRMSVGAQRRHVIRLVVGEVAAVFCAGTLIGLPLALGLAGFLRKMLYEVSTSDPLALGGTIALLAAGGWLAAWLPGRRATRIDPVQALRYE